VPTPITPALNMWYPGGGLVTVRLNPKAVRLLEARGGLFALDRHLRRVRKTNEASWPVQMTGAAGQAPVAGRLCVVRKSQAAIAKAQAKVARSASRNLAPCKPTPCSTPNM
jgi:hypothetical protein